MNRSGIAKAILRFISTAPGRPGAWTGGGSTPDFEFDKIDRPTKVLSICLSSCRSVFLPFYLPCGLFCLPIFFSFPLFPFFFLEIYSPMPFTVRRQGGLPDLTPLPGRHWSCIRPWFFLLSLFLFLFSLPTHDQLTLRVKKRDVMYS